MLKKFYVHNYKCLENFEFHANELNTSFLLGKNGSGKTTFFNAVEVFQKIGRGVTYLKELVDQKDFNSSDKLAPIEFEIESVINKKHFSYKLSIEFPDNFISPKVKVETLSVEKKIIFERNGGQTSLNNAAHFVLDWHHVGLSLISEKSDNDPISTFRNWLHDIIILSPYPRNFHYLSRSESSMIDREASNVLDWARWLLSSNPSLYTTMHHFLQFRMPDLELFKWDNAGREERKLMFIFKAPGDYEELAIEFSQLSDGEKIFFLASTIIAAQKNNPSLLCLWDEPDNFIGLVELNHFIGELRKVFEASSSQAQLMMTSHNERVINNFSNHNIFVLSRSSHLSPTRIKNLDSHSYHSKTIVDAYDNGELD